MISLSCLSMYSPFIKFAPERGKQRPDVWTKILWHVLLFFLPDIIRYMGYTLLLVDRETLFRSLLFVSRWDLWIKQYILSVFVKVFVNNRCTLTVKFILNGLSQQCRNKSNRTILESKTRNNKCNNKYTMSMITWLYTQRTSRATRSFK